VLHLWETTEKVLALGDRVRPARSIAFPWKSAGFQGGGGGCLGWRIGSRASSTAWCSDLLREDSIYALLAEHGDRIVRDEDFAECYSERQGRPAIPPSLLAKVLLLAYREGLSDERAMEALRFDLRWKVALDLPWVFERTVPGAASRRELARPPARHARAGWRTSRSWRSGVCAPAQATSSQPTRHRAATRPHRRLRQCPPRAPSRSASHAASRVACTGTVMCAESYRRGPLTQERRLPPVDAVRLGG
jgi:Transposase domain (DUF772)